MNINCCHVAITGLIGWTISSTIQHIRIAKIRAKEVEIELRTKELEKKNGSELAEIAKLKQRINHLENFTGNADISSQSEVYQPKKPELKKDHDQ